MKKCLSLLMSVLLMLSCCMVALAEEETLDLYIQMDVTMEDGAIYVDLVDDQGGTVSTWPVSLEIDGVQVDTATTDEYGTATFRYSIPDDAQQIACVAQDGQFEQYRFIGCKVYLDYTPVTDANDPEQDEPEEETDSPTEDEDTAPEMTTSVVVQTTATTVNTTNVLPTTSVSGDRVAIGVIADNPLLIATGSTQTDYQSRGRMWMDNTLYRSLVPSSASTLVLQLTHNAQAGDQTRLIAAKNANAAYASYTDEEVKGFAMDLTVAYMDAYSIVPLDIEDGMYIVEMPVPAGLRSCEKLAVAVCTSEGLATLIEVTPSGGMLNFTLQRFQTLAIVGFGSSTMSLDSLSNTPWLLIVAIVLGVLMIAGGIVLLVFVSFRKKPTRASKSIKETPAATSSVSFEAEEDDEEESVLVPAIAEEPAPVIRTPQPQTSASVESQSVTTPTDTASMDELDELLNDVLNDLDSI